MRNITETIGINETYARIEEGINRLYDAGERLMEAYRTASQGIEETIRHVSSQLEKCDDAMKAECSK